MAESQQVVDGHDPSPMKESGDAQVTNPFPNPDAEHLEKEEGGIDFDQDMFNQIMNKKSDDGEDNNNPDFNFGS